MINSLLPLLLLLSLECLAQGNVPTKTTSPQPIPSGPHVVGVFDGRTPCQQMAAQQHVQVRPECHKIKWRIILYQDPVTQTPTTCVVKGIFLWDDTRKTKWVIEKGIPADPDAVVFHLAPGEPDSMYLLKGDDNVLFFLDKEKKLMVGNSDFGYNLYRVEN